MDGVVGDAKIMLNIANWIVTAQNRTYWRKLGEEA